MQIKRLFSRILVVLPLLVLPAFADNAEDDDLPKVQLISCQEQCANFVPAKVISVDVPQFPRDQYSWTRTYSEAAVELLYTIGPDGKVRDDVLLLSLIGPREFADNLIEKVRTWTFEPATSNGKPIAVSITYPLKYIRNPEDGTMVGKRMILTPLEVVQAMKAARLLDEQGKVEEARAKLDGVLKNVKLTFADRTMVASASASLAAKQGDYLEARRLAVMATAVIAPNLRPEIQKEAWQSRIKADLALREIPDALLSLTRLQKLVGASDISLPNLMQTIRKAAEDEPVLTVQAQIPPADESDVYTFTPYRRSFTFQKVQGSLQKFVLACRQATMESDITPSAQWRIPGNWSDCSVYVRGAPGTRFAVLQPKT